MGQNLQLTDPVSTPKVEDTERLGLQKQVTKDGIWRTVRLADSDIRLMTSDKVNTAAYTYTNQSTPSGFGLSGPSAIAWTIIGNTCLLNVSLVGILNAPASSYYLLIKLPDNIRVVNRDTAPHTFNAVAKASDGSGTLFFAILQAIPPGAVPSSGTAVVDNSNWLVAFPNTGAAWFNGNANINISGQLFFEVDRDN